MAAVVTASAEIRARRARSRAAKPMTRAASADDVTAPASARSPTATITQPRAAAAPAAATARPVEYDETPNATAMTTAQATWTRTFSPSRVRADRNRVAEALSDRKDDRDAHGYAEREHDDLERPRPGRDVVALEGVLSRADDRESGQQQDDARRHDERW